MAKKDCTKQQTESKVVSGNEFLALVHQFDQEGQRKLLVMIKALVRQKELGFTMDEWKAWSEELFGKKSATHLTDKFNALLSA